MNFSDVPNITAGYSSLDDVMKEENFVLWMTKAVTLSTTILSVLGILSDVVAFRISWGLPEKKSAKSLMQMQAAADCFQCVFLLLGAIRRLKGWAKFLRIQTLLKCNSPEQTLQLDTSNIISNVH